MPGEAPRELAITRAIDALPAGAWKGMHDVRLPARRLATVDHLVVGRAGLFVIDSRDWTGELEVGPDGLTEDGTSREATVARIADSARALVELIPSLDPDHVVPVLCFDRDEPLTGWVGNVLVCTAGNFVDLLTTQRRIWTPIEADRAFDQLAWGMPSDWYRIAEPSGPPRTGHRLEGRAQKLPATSRRSPSRRARSTRAEHMTPWVRAALIAVACCLVMISSIRYGTWPGSVT